MQDFELFVEGKKDKIHLDKNGGATPVGKDEVEVFKKADLITLPKGVEGTNCGNCRFFKKEEGNQGWCENKNVEQLVTDRNCCKFWDRTDIKRKWGEMVE